MSPAAYTWSPVTGISDVYSQSPMAYPDTTTTYTVVVQAGACQYSDTITLEVKPSPDAAFFTSNPTICIENPEVQFFENATYELAYIWNFGDGSAVSNEPNPLHTYSQSGTYHPMLIAVSEGGCADTAATQTIVISPQVVAAFSSTPTFSDTVYLPEAVVQFQNLSLYADQYVWTFGDSQVSSDINPTHIFQESGDFLVTLTATNTQGCKDTVQQNYHIAPPSLFIPNIFTPNQDGVHDTFGVHYTGKEKFFLEVYDRWGVKMFESDNPNQDWEGTTPAGKPASDGNYYYVITIGKKNYTGYVLILR
jgi:gliding motility-associated-like protein